MDFYESELTVAIRKEIFQDHKIYTQNILFYDSEDDSFSSPLDKFISNDQRFKIYIFHFGTYQDYFYAKVVPTDRYKILSDMED